MRALTRSWETSFLHHIARPFEKGCYASLLQDLQRLLEALMRIRLFNVRLCRASEYSVNAVQLVREEGTCRMYPSHRRPHGRKGQSPGTDIGGVVYPFINAASNTVSRIQMQCVLCMQLCVE